MVLQKRFGNPQKQFVECYWLIYYHAVDKGGHFAAWEQPNFSLRRSARRSDHGSAHRVGATFPR